jgi:hypothetical protein
VVTGIVLVSTSRRGVVVGATVSGTTTGRRVVVYGGRTTGRRRALTCTSSTVVSLAAATRRRRALTVSTVGWGVVAAAATTVSRGRITGRRRGVAARVASTVRRDRPSTGSSITARGIATSAVSNSSSSFVSKAGDAIATVLGLIEEFTGSLKVLESLELDSSVQMSAGAREWKS